MLKGSAIVVDSSLFRSPFDGHAVGDQPTRTGAIGVRLSASRLPCVALVSTWPAAMPLLCEKLGEVLGQTPPALTGQMTQCASGLVIRTGPEEFMIVADAIGAEGFDLKVTLREAIPPEVGSLTDLSHARCCIHIGGSNCLDVLPKLFALDFRETEFPVGTARLSGHHHLPCTVHRLGLAEFKLYVFSTYALDQLESLLDAALEYGVSLAHA